MLFYEVISEELPLEGRSHDRRGGYLRFGDSLCRDCHGLWALHLFGYLSLFTRRRNPTGLFLSCFLSLRGQSLACRRAGPRQSNVNIFVRLLRFARNDGCVKIKIMYDVVAIGSATRDNFLKANYPLTNWPAAPLKKAIALPLGEKLGVDEAFFVLGGNSVNASVTFARHGFKAGCLAKLGKDLPGAEIAQELKDEGVDPSLCVYTGEKPTAYSALLLRNGERTILSYHGASDTLSMRDLDLEKLKARWWYISLAGESDAMYPSLIQFATKNKIKVAFNPSGHHIHHWPNEILDSLKDIEFLVLNTGEAADLLKMPYKKEKEVFKELDKRMPGIVAVTNGPNGAVVSDGKHIYRSGIYREKAIVDRTGAGDAFGSGFTAMLARLRNYGDADSIKKAIRFASANATSVVEHIGATEGILTREQFEKDNRWKNLEIKIENLNP